MKVGHTRHWVSPEGKEPTKASLHQGLKACCFNLESDGGHGHTRLVFVLSWHNFHCGLQSFVLVCNCVLQGPSDGELVLFGCSQVDCS